MQPPVRQLDLRCKLKGPNIDNMNWAQIIAACIIAGVTLLNLFFTVKGARESRRSEVRQKYVDRQSDALETWWLLTVQPSPFKQLEQTEQDDLIRRFIWLPRAVRSTAESVMKQDNVQSRDSLRKSISSYLVTRIDEGQENE